jgi:flagellar hook-associated protein 3 FlgL
MSDGKALHRPSDNPINTARAMNFKTSLTVNDQFKTNCQTARSWMESTDSALGQIGDIVKEVNDLVTKATSSTNGPQEFKVYGTQIDELINQAVVIGNTKIGDRYIFSGQADKIQPFNRVNLSTGDNVVYSGDTGKISMRISPGSANSMEDSINTTGVDVFGGSTMVDGKSTMDVFSKLINIKNMLKNGNVNLDQLSQEQNTLSSIQDQILEARTQLGTRSAMYEMAENMLTDNTQTITTDLAHAEDIDMAKAITDFNNAQSLYKAALSVGAKVIPPTLVDFLK